MSWAKCRAKMIIVLIKTSFVSTMELYFIWGSINLQPDCYTLGKSGTIFYKHDIDYTSHDFYFINYSTSMMCKVISWILHLFTYRPWIATVWFTRTCYLTSFYMMDDTACTERDVLLMMYLYCEFGSVLSLPRLVSFIAPRHSRATRLNGMLLPFCFTVT